MSADYYIQCARSYAGDAVIWWRANGAGYTPDIDDAGLYTLEDAESKERNRPGVDVKWHKNVVERAIVRTVDIGRLRKVASEEGV
jgi:hypothetical protein